MSEIFNVKSSKLFAIKVKGDYHDTDKITIMVAIEQEGVVGDIATTKIKSIDTVVDKAYISRLIDHLQESLDKMGGSKRWKK